MSNKYVYEKGKKCFLIEWRDQQETVEKIK